jgi:hypothetical protein
MKEKSGCSSTRKILFPVKIKLVLTTSNVNIDLNGGRFLRQVQINYMHAVFSADKS